MCDITGKLLKYVSLVGTKRCARFCGGGRGGAAGSALGEGVCFRAPEGYRELWLSVFFYRILLNLFLVNFVAF